MKKIFVDALSDIPNKLKKDIKVLPYLFNIDGTLYLTSEITNTQILKWMDEGKIIQTSRPELGIWIKLVEEEFSKGNDILYIGSLKNLTGAYSSLNIISGLLKSKYPEREIVLLDTNLSSGGILLCVKKYLESKDIEELRFLKEEKIKSFVIMGNTETIYKNNRANINISTPTSFIEDKEGLKFNRTYKTLKEAFEDAERTIPKETKRMNITYSYDLKDSELLKEVYNKYQNKIEDFYEVNPCLYTYVGKNSILFNYQEV